jgi:hypothetical protein
LKCPVHSLHHAPPPEVERRYGPEYSASRSFMDLARISHR